MGRKDNFITAILGILIIGIFLITVYFCLDIFEIIEVPEEYSLAKFFGSKISDVSVAYPITEAIDESTIDDWMNQDGGQTEENIDINTISENIVALNNTEQMTSTLITSDDVVKRMYYSQLDIYGKMIYDEINAHREDLKTGTYILNFGSKFNDLLHEEKGSLTLEKAFQLSINAFLFDNPEIFYLDITKMYMSTEVTTFGPIKTYKVKIGPLDGKNYLSDFFKYKEMVDVAEEELEGIKENIKAQLYGDAYAKTKAIHDYIIDNTTYDQSLSRPNIYNAYGTLRGKYAVCEGYAKAMKYLLDDLGIPCVIACGTARNSYGQIESHAWNYVKIDGNWYAVDSTWDDPVIVGTGSVSQAVYKKYFLTGSRAFFEDHFEDGNIVEGSSFVYPTLSEENYR